jgi:hypothetical protein
MWIGGDPPKIMETDARRGYCYAGKESNLKNILRAGANEDDLLTRIQRGGW